MVRCDVGPSIGVGHVMRCLALAEEFAARGYAVDFCADLDSVSFAAAQVAARGFGHVPPPAAGATAEEEVAHLVALGPRVVVVDSYRLPVAVYAGLAARVPTLAIVDGDPLGRPAHLYVDQNIGAERDTWLLPDGAVRLAGLDYALMRDDIRALRPAAPERSEQQPPRVLAFFGGTDAFGAAPVLTRALVATGAPLDLTVVGGTPPLRDELAAIVPGADQRIEVIAPTPAIARLVADADLVVSAAGTSSWELLTLGACCALVAVADNQHESYARVVERGVVAGLGHLEDVRADPAAATATLAALLTDPDARAGLRRAAWTEVDGHGRARVVDAVESLLRAG